MNIAALREVQKSIADEANPFDMCYWHCCIAGHVYKVGNSGSSYEKGYVKRNFAVSYLDLTWEEACDLFSSDQEFLPTDREGAIRLIEELIQSHLGEQSHSSLGEQSGAQPMVLRRSGPDGPYSSEATPAPVEEELVGV